MVQVQIGTHSFTFDHVYGSTGSSSSAMFEECVAPLVDGLFQGYNATVLAYGQVNPSLHGKLLNLKQSVTYALQYHIPLEIVIVDILRCCRQDLGKHTPWALASKTVLKWD